MGWTNKAPNTKHKKGTSDVEHDSSGANTKNMSVGTLATIQAV